MPKIQPCRNGCGTQITVQLDEASGKYKPYEIDDHTGDYELHNCPKSPYNQNKGQWGQKPSTTNFATKPKYTKEELGSTFTPTDIPKTSQGGLPLDTKRLLQQVMELVKEIRDFRQEIKTMIQEATIVDTARYENQISWIYDKIPEEQKDKDFKSAKDYHDQLTKPIIDPVTVNHSKIADDKQNFMQPKKDRVPPQTKFHDESREKTLDERIPDDPEEFAVAQALKDDEGVIDEE